MISISEEQLVKYLDQTNLQPQVSKDEMRRFLEEARAYDFYGVAIMPAWVPLASEILEGSDTRIVAAIAFPLGTLPTKLKVQETKWVIANSLPSTEIDMVINNAFLKAREYGKVRDDICAVVEAAEGHTVKVIIEVPALTRDEAVIASLISQEAGAQFVKTSTGFKGFRFMRPTTVEDVKLIKSVVGDRVKVKAAGGISRLDQVLAIVEAGASRVGTSSGVRIVETYRQYKKLL